jgi:hypothetical protein
MNQIRIKQLVVTAFFTAIAFTATSQNYIDTLYRISSTMDVVYGKAIDFAGNERTLDMDVSVPTNDTPPACGRPLMVLVHGGGFYTGDKSDNAVRRMRMEFAQRGYVAVSVNYRLGMFQTDKRIHCNVTSWDCLNMADTSEWYRAYYRAIQDVHGAIRYLVDAKSMYNLDPNNVFIAGTSAGGFVSLGVGFIDNQNEVTNSLVSDLGNIKAPNTLYEQQCVQKFNLDTNISSMQLERKALGGYAGDLNTQVTEKYTIRGVGNFYGAVFDSIFESSGNQPALYMYHQPNDLIVPFNFGSVYGGFSVCAQQFPFNCQGIVNRPMVHGSNAIKSIIDGIKNGGRNAPDYQFDKTTNTANCAQQLANASVVGHAIDNYWLRTTNMAKFLANYVVDCGNSSVKEVTRNSAVTVYPNPVGSDQILSLHGDFRKGDKLTLCSSDGRVLYNVTLTENTSNYRFRPADYRFNSGLYYLTVKTKTSTVTQKVVVVD